METEFTATIPKQVAPWRPRPRSLGHQKPSVQTIEMEKCSLLSLRPGMLARIPGPVEPSCRQDEHALPTRADPIPAGESLEQIARGWCQATALSIPVSAGPASCGHVARAPAPGLLHSPESPALLHAQPQARPPAGQSWEASGR